jgi:hypothetical protein
MTSLLTWDEAETFGGKLPFLRSACGRKRSGANFADGCDLTSSIDGGPGIARLGRDHRSMAHRVERAVAEPCPICSFDSLHEFILACWSRLLKLDHQRRPVTELGAASAADGEGVSSRTVSNAMSLQSAAFRRDSMMPRS